MPNNVSREIKDSLQEYSKLLLKWNNKINLISKTTEIDLWDRHIEDSLQLERFLDKAETILDIGSGGGLPGVVLSIMGFRLILVECDLRKASFLRETIRKLGLKAELIEERVENIKVKCNTITSRAFASVESILDHTQNIDCGRFLLLKGKNVDKELLDANKKWIFDYKKYKSITSEDSCILEITNAQRKA
jgi:16S rRNA (guanine527-N7)-methyltransferase